MSHKTKILKMRSGNSLIAELADDHTTRITLIRPMDIKYMCYVDRGGTKREMMVLLDWLKETTLAQVLIEKSDIMCILDPDPDVVAQYDAKKIMDDREDDEDTSPSGMQRRFFGGSASDDKEPKVFFLGPKNSSPENMIKNLDEMLESLGISPEDIEDLGGPPQQGSIEDRNTDRQLDVTNDPSYGSCYSDWSPNLEDYLT